MKSEGFSVIQIIQLILAPAVMINACGLLLLATSSKYLERPEQNPLAE